VQLVLFDCADDGEEVADHQAELDRARRVLETTERRVGVKHRPDGTEEPGEEAAEG
jgi:hypothetical protein